MVSNKSSNQGKEKILLAMLPFWDPLLPPVWVSCLKRFLQEHGYDVRTVDANIKSQYKEIYDKYFETLKACIPQDKRSSFYNIGKDVLRNHMMAHFHYKDEEEYIQLVKLLVLKTYFHEVECQQIIELNRLLAAFYKRLEVNLFQLLDTERPAVLGISIFKGSFPASLYTFKYAKKYDPCLKTVMGGGIFADQLAVGSPDWEFFLEKTPYIDKIIFGEGEYTFLYYLEGKLPKSKKVFTLEDIDGKLFDISSQVVPDFSDFELHYYPYLGMYTSRGCHYQCGFCSETVRWKKYRKKSASQVVEELRKFCQLYGTRLFLVSNSLLNPTVTPLAEELEKADLGVYWDGYLRVDKHSCNPDVTLQWKRGGFYRARLSVESGSARILEMMGKRVTPRQIKETVVNLAHAGIKTTTYWVIGYPGENEVDFQQTLDMVAVLKNDIYKAEFNAFWYFLSAQVKAEEWFPKSMLLSPEKAKDMVILPTYILDGQSSREENYGRMRRFAEWITRLGIPNPYSLHDIYQADERWKKLYKNAVPSLLELRDKDSCIDECKTVNKYSAAQNILQEELNFGF
jgi:radical SAM superfamily enzyme YgiQ (UPF0313 family)